MTEDGALSELLRNRRWLQRLDPFPHVFVRDLFTPEVYEALACVFERILARGLSEKPRAGRFSRNMPGYDAYALPFSSEGLGALRLFLSRPWHDLLARVMGVNATGDLDGGLHHHRVGSRSGEPHNDLAPGWFADYETPDGIRLARSELCNYFNGTTPEPGTPVRETVRG